MTAPFSLRRLGPEDAESFRELRLEGLRLHPDCFGADWEEESQKPIAFFAERLERGWVLGGGVGASLAGVGGLYFPAEPKARHKAWIWGMYVRAEARGAGLGHALVAGLLQRAAEVAEIVHLTVTSTNVGAMRLYAAAGFTVYGLEVHALKLADRYVDELLMVRPARLAPPAPAPG